MSIRREIENKLINEINKDLKVLWGLLPKELSNKENINLVSYCIKIGNKWKTKLWEGMIIKNGRLKSETPQIQV